jgi:hypothetical protein
VPVYTVEFRDLIPIPVYLNVTPRPSPHAGEDEAMLSALFPDTEEKIPKEMPTLDFIVNPDYSVSLTGNKQ